MPFYHMTSALVMWPHGVSSDSLGAHNNLVQYLDMTQFSVASTHVTGRLLNTSFWLVNTRQNLSYLLHRISMEVL